MFFTPDPHGLGPSVAARFTVTSALSQPFAFAGGAREPTVTGAWLSGSYVNLLAPDVALVPIGVWTVTSTVPAPWAGAVAVIDSGVTTVELAVTDPNFTVAP